MENGDSTDTGSEDDNGEFAHLKTHIVPEDVSELEHGIDTHILRHFMENHCTVDRVKGDDLVTTNTDMMDAFLTWAELDGVEDDLDQLSPEVNESNRKGT